MKDDLDALRAVVQRGWMTRHEATIGFTKARRAGQSFLNYAIQEGALTSSQLSELQASLRSFAPSPSSAGRLQAGQFVAGYVLEEKLGEGGMGVVYRARKNSQRFALKALLKHGRDAKSRFQREIDSLKELSDHPHILSIIDWGQEPFPYFVTELIEGFDLGEFCRREGPVPIQQAIPLISQIAEALSFAHKQGILHRDLKSSNVLLKNTEHAILCDFGLAKAAEADSLTQSNEWLGTLPYMSPEQVSGDLKNLDERSDIWSLGVLFYFVLTHELPFQGQTSLEVIPAILFNDVQRSQLIPKKLYTIIKTCLAKEIDQRYRSVDLFLSDLKAFQHEPIATKRGTKKTWLLVLFAALVIALFSVLFLNLQRQEQIRQEQSALLQKVEGLPNDPLSEDALFHILIEESPGFLSSKKRSQSLIVNWREQARTLEDILAHHQFQSLDGHVKESVRNKAQRVALALRVYQSFRKEKVTEAHTAVKLSKEWQEFSLALEARQEGRLNSFQSILKSLRKGRTDCAVASRFLLVCQAVQEEDWALAQKRLDQSELPEILARRARDFDIPRKLFFEYCTKKPIPEKALASAYRQLKLNRIQRVKLQRELNQFYSQDERTQKNAQCYESVLILTEETALRRPSAHWTWHQESARRCMQKGKLARAGYHHYCAANSYKNYKIPPSFQRYQFRDALQIQLRLAKNREEASQVLIRNFEKLWEAAHAHWFFENALSQKDFNHSVIQNYLKDVLDRRPQEALAKFFYVLSKRGTFKARETLKRATQRLESLDRYVQECLESKLPDHFKAIALQTQLNNWKEYRGNHKGELRAVDAVTRRYRQIQILKDLQHPDPRRVIAIEIYCLKTLLSLKRKTLTKAEFHQKEREIAKKFLEISAAVTMLREKTKLKKRNTERPRFNPWPRLSQESFRTRFCAAQTEASKHFILAGQSEQGREVLKACLPLVREDLRLAPFVIDIFLQLKDKTAAKALLQQFRVVAVSASDKAKVAKYDQRLNSESQEE